MTCHKTSGLSKHKRECYPFRESEIIYPSELKHLWKKMENLLETIVFLISMILCYLKCWALYKYQITITSMNQNILKELNFFCIYCLGFINVSLVSNMTQEKSHTLKFKIQGSSIIWRSFVGVMELEFSLIYRFTKSFRFIFIILCLCSYFQGYLLLWYLHALLNSQFYQHPQTSDSASGNREMLKHRLNYCTYVNDNYNDRMES